MPKAKRPLASPLSKSALRRKVGKSPEIKPPEPKAQESRPRESKPRGTKPREDKPQGNKSRENKHKKPTLQDIKLNADKPKKHIKVLVILDTIFRVVRGIRSLDNSTRRDLILVISFFLIIYQYIRVLVVDIKYFILRWTSPAEPLVSSSSLDFSPPPNRTPKGLPQPSPTLTLTPRPVPRLWVSGLSSVPAGSSYVGEH